MDSVDLHKDDGLPKAEAEAEAEAIDCLVPITPDAVIENGDSQPQSPLTLTVVRNQFKLACIGSDSESGSPRTPKDCVFDPFAPGPDIMARAPPSYKYVDEYRVTVARQLNFHPSFDLFQHQDAQSLSDEDMVESVYKNLLEVIVSQQTDGLLAQISSPYKSPPSPLRVTGISDTCPPAPIKPPAKPRNIQVGLCKKLEF